MPNLSRLTFLSWAKEAAIVPGTAPTPVAPTLFLPYTSLKPEDIPDYESDDSIANNVTKYRGLYLGWLDGMVSAGGRLYPEAVGPLLVMAGWADTVTGTNPYTHTFKIPSAGTQPPTYTLTIWDGTTASSNARQYPGAILDTLDFIADAKGNLKWKATWKTFPSVTVAKPTPTWSTSTPFMGWEIAPSIGGAAVPRIISSQLSIKRNSEIPHTQNNTRNPYTSLAADAEADWKIKAIMETESDWLHIINNDQPAVSMVTTSVYGSPAPVLTFTHASAAWIKAPRDYTTKWVQLDADIRGFYNSTDQGPGFLTLLNGTATAY